MAYSAIKHQTIIRVNENGSVIAPDELATEEPLEIRLEFGPQTNRQIRNIAVTMRTPGNDAELAAGFLFTEGIIRDADDVAHVAHCFIACAENRENVIQVSFDENTVPHLQNSERNFFTTSSCGVCGKGSIAAIRTVNNNWQPDDTNTVTDAVLYTLPDILRHHQSVFDDTGGLHASALFGANGQFLLSREDVGRHNALDKLIGAVLLDKDCDFQTPLKDHILMLSGRASFELVQKAVMAGINIIAAVGAPSSLAVQLAEEFNCTLIGFLRGKRFNIYTGSHRVIMAANVVAQPAL